MIERCVEDEVAVEKPAWLWWLEVGSRIDISSEVAALDLPVLVIAGDNDKVLGLRTAIEVARGLQDAELRFVGEGGHLVPLEQPEAVAISIRRFVDDLTMRSA
jgi:pimeloyl-ACP methyl ester carboxylesterase